MTETVPENFPVIDYYYALISPWTYLGGPRLEHIARRHGVGIAYKPIDLAQVLPHTGGVPLAKRAPARQAYRLTELERWRAYLGVPLNLHPAHFPVPEWPAAGMVIAMARAEGALGEDPGALSNAILRAVWAEERDISDTGTLLAIAAEQGLDGPALLAAGADLKAVWDANSAEAVARGVFGVPTYVWNDSLYWGQDRLDFLDQTLEADLEDTLGM
ncbi:MAG: 2-hydroxychromene-2-carboxylate isomerase [Rhodobacterales bacterium]|nr:2-hydroxychromene-2-carboxylate isomerase [Rhodobacterales bacterium]